MKESRGSRLLGKWRKARGLTQQRAAELIGCDQGKYSQYERGTARPGLHRAVVIRSVTGVPVEDWIVSRESEAA